jgi:hypothetical protein
MPTTTTTTTCIKGAVRRRTEQARLAPTGRDPGAARRRPVPRRGDSAIAEDGYLGRVDEVVLATDGSLAYIVIRVGPIWHRRRPVISSALVADATQRGRHVLLLGGRAALARLPEALPIVI